MNRGTRIRGAAAALASALLVLLGALTTVEAQRVSPERRSHDLQPGEFVWTPELAPSGPVVILVSISEQRLHAYRNGVQIGYSTVSTGKPGHETPTGVFTVLQKDADHVSNLFPGAKMPNMERLTWSGIALHAGKLPGYPASHGCVRLPLELSKLLFELDAVGTTVVLADDHGGPREAAHPGAILSPMLSATPATGERTGVVSYHWQPERAPQGPVNILVSAGERSLYVYRNGIEIGRAELTFRSDRTRLPEGVYTVLEGYGTGKSPFAPNRPDHRWMGVPLDRAPLAGPQEKAELASLVQIPSEFGHHVYEALAPGTTIFVTNREVAPHTTTSSDYVIMATQPDEVGS